MLIVENWFSCIDSWEFLLVSQKEGLGDILGNRARHFWPKIIGCAGSSFSRKCEMHHHYLLFYPPTFLPLITLQIRTSVSLSFNHTHLRFLIFWLWIVFILPYSFDGGGASAWGDMYNVWCHYFDGQLTIQICRILSVLEINIWRK